MEQILHDLGLTTLEVNIYRILLNQGSISAGDISQKTGIHRRNVYDCLERLIQKGFVGYIKENNVKKYSITNPQRIKEKLDEKNKEFEQLMPELLSKFNAITEKKETLFFRGKEGLRQIFDDQISVGKEVLVNATPVKVSHFLKYFFPKYQILRKEKKVHTRMIFDKSMQSDVTHSDFVKNLPFAKVKYIKDFNKSPMSQYIYGDNVAIVVWSDDPIAILIRQKEIAQGFRESFELIWKMAE